MKNNPLLPLRSRIHEMGLTSFHKKYLIFLYLQGYLTSEMARLTDHDAENVDRYIEKLLWRESRSSALF
jgi:hypothetical protein